MKKLLAALALNALLLVSTLQAQDIYILHDSGTQDSIAAILTNAGMNVEIGLPYRGFTTQDISEYSLVILLNGVTWSSAVPQSGQDNLRQYILNGGVMMSTEWISWSGSTNETLNSIIPITYGGSWGTGSETYTVMAEHQITEDLPDSFEVPSGWSFSATDRKEDPTLNAITLIQGSRSRDALVVGDFGNGSIIHWNMGGHYNSRNIWSAEVRQILINIARFIVPVSRVMLQSPMNHSEGIAPATEFTWREVANADYYKLQIATDDDFSELVIDVDLADNTTYVPIQELELQTTYFWRVRASIDGTDGDWSRTWTFRTQTPSSADATDAPIAFRLYGNYPNPFNPATSIRYDLPSASHVRLEVVDLLGRTIATLIDHEQPAGRHEVTFDASQLAGGVYIYRIRTDEFTSARSMLLVK